jgi:thioester reductase-like protein
MKFTLITGATGLLGCFVLQQGLRAGLPLAALVRGDQARERLEILLSQFPEGERQALPPDFPVLKGDIGEAGLALSESDANWIGLHCDAVLNCAGVVKFQAEAGGEPYRTNFDGTRHLLAFCKQAKIPHFHQVSTAYVCGQRAGTVLESELDAGQMFHNDYERSKYMAEILVSESTGFESVSIYRPSVVLGDALTGFTPTFQGAYSLLWAGWAVAQEGLQRDQFLASLGLDEQDCINLVTAD